MDKRRFGVLVILSSALFGCQVVPHIESGPNVALIDKEQQEEEEFVHMQAPIARAGSPTETSDTSGGPPVTEYQCMQQVREQVVTTRDQHWTQKRIDAAIDRCMKSTQP